MPALHSPNESIVSVDDDGDGSASKLDNNIPRRHYEAEKDRKESNRRWGELANKMGTLVEDIVASSLPPRIVSELFGCDQSDFFGVRQRKRKDGAAREWTRGRKRTACCADSPSWAFEASKASRVRLSTYREACSFQSSKVDYGRGSFAPFSACCPSLSYFISNRLRAITSMPATSPRRLSCPFP